MQNTVLVIIGRKGSGKSTLAAEVMAERDRVWVIDSLAEYGAERGFEVVEGFEACCDAIERSTARDRFHLSLRCISVEDNLDLMHLCYIASNETERPTLAVEETSLYVSASQLPEQVAELVRYGRHRELDLIFIARRPAELHRDLTANCDVLVTFQTQEPRDILYLRSFYGDEALQLPTLPPYHVRVFGEFDKAPSAVLHRIAEQGD